MYPIKLKGFSLIELMVAIIIIAILVTIAFPIYQGFISRTQINSSYQTLSNLKTPIDLKVYRSEEITNIEDVGWISGNSNLIHTDPTVTIDAGTEEITLTATLDGNVHSLILGAEIELLRDVDGGWTCVIVKPNTAKWSSNIAPTSCQVVTSS